jgi:protein-arginine kinase activator protein McsA
MDQADDSSASNSGRRGKVARLIEEYDLLGIGEELEQMWTAEENRRSLRELAAYFNQQLLQRAFEEASAQYLDGEIENTYRPLTEDDVSRAETTRVERRLERDGIDVEAVRDDFVTYQAIRSYLKDNRGAEYTQSSQEPLEREKTNVQKLRGRMVSVIDGNIQQLQESNEVTLGEFQTLADIRIVCEDCNSQFEILELLDRGGCHCNTETE